MSANSTAGHDSFGRIGAMTVGSQVLTGLLSVNRLQPFNLQPDQLQTREPLFLDDLSGNNLDPNVTAYLGHEAEKPLVQ